MAKTTWLKKGPVYIGFDEYTGEQRVDFDRSSWPEKRGHGVFEDAQGMPVYCWRDAGSWLPRAVFVLWEFQNVSGAIHLVHVNGNYWGRGKWAKWMFLLILLAGSAFIFNWQWMAYWNQPAVNTTDSLTQIVFIPVFKYLLMIILWFPASWLAPFLAEWFTRELAWTGKHAQIDIRQWKNLTSVEITDSTKAYGGLRNIEPIASKGDLRTLIMAHFGTKEPFIDMSRSVYSNSSAGILVQNIILNFIEERQSYLDKLATSPEGKFKKDTKSVMWTGAINAPDRL